MKVVAFHLARKEPISCYQRMVSLPFLKAAINEKDLVYIEKQIDYEVRVAKENLKDKWFKDAVEIYVVHQSKFNCIID